AGCLQHFGWQCSHALLAQRADRAYAHGLLWPALLHAALLSGLLLVPVTPEQGALLAAGVAALAHGLYFAAGWRCTRPAAARLLLGPLLVALATGLAAWLAGPWFSGTTALLTQLVAGGAAFAAGLWWCELRGRWRRVGDGLVAASGFRA
ncbi:MAG: hypothetical protein WBO45_21000, partial [Planctomycetota bacterium]